MGRKTVIQKYLNYSKFIIQNSKFKIQN